MSDVGKKIDVGEKIDHLVMVLDARMSVMENEQINTRSWVERLTNAIDRLTESSREHLALRQKVTSIEQAQTDIALDVDGLDTRMSDQEKKSGIREWMTNGLIALVSATIGVVIGKIAGLF